MPVYKFHVTTGIDQSIKQFRHCHNMISYEVKALWLTSLPPCNVALVLNV